MTVRAAVLPYLHGRCGLVVASGETAPLATLATESFEVGELVPIPLDQRIDQRDMRREITSAHIADVVGRIAATVLSHGAQHVTIDLPAELKGKTAQKHARAVAGALAARLEAEGIANDFEDARWRNRLDGMVQEHNERALAISRHAFTQWPEPFDLDGRPVRNEAVNIAGALLVHKLAPGMISDVKPASASPAKRPATPDTVLEDALQESVAAAPRPVPAPPAPLPGVPRVAACDPGSAELTIAIAEGTGAPYRFIAARAFETERRELTYEQAAELAVDAVKWLLKCGVKKLLIEHVKAVYFFGVQLHAAAGIATDHVRTARVATALAMMALAKGIEVVPVPAQTWRARVVGKSNPKDETIAPAVIACFDAFPAVSNSHLRDASGLALFGLLPPEEPESPKRLRSPRPPRDPNAPPPVRARNRDESHRKRYDEPNRIAARQVRREKEAARRSAAGCTCPPRGRHRRGCKLAPSKHSEHNTP